MATVTDLPSSLRHQLASVTRRIRCLQALRGASVLLLVMVLTGVAALLADYWLDLSASVRQVLLPCWLGLGAVVAGSCLLRPLARRLDPEALAAVIEEKYPDLGERLTSAVELAGGGDAYHGSPALISLLMEDAEKRTSGLDVWRAFPGRTAARLTAAAAVVFLMALSPALLWPERSAALGQRFLFPWRQQPVILPYTLEVTPGDVFTAAGRPLTLSVRLLPNDETVALPRTASLVRHSAEGGSVRERMLADRTDAFSLKLDRVPGDFSYHVEAGLAVSPDYQVTAVEPVDLAAGSPTITITAPEYARKNVDAQTVQGLADLTALQHSQIHFDFRFNRPALAAHLEWKPRAGETTKDKDLAATVLPLELSAGGSTAQLNLPAQADGTFTLVLDAEHGIRTELEPRLLTVKVDQPPVFTKVSGTDELKVIHPYDSLPLEVSVADDVGVDLAEVEYRINNGPSALEAMPLSGRGTRQAVGQLSFRLSDKVKEGDTVLYRFKAADNRRVPEAGLEPQVIYHPEEAKPGQPRWRTLKVARKAEPLQQQEILAQADNINRRLDNIISDLLHEERGVYKLRMESQQQPTLKPDQVSDLKQLRQENRSVETALQELARDVAETPALQPLAEQAQDIAAKEMRHSDQALGKAQDKTAKAETRDQKLQQADKEVAAALQRLVDLKKENERLTQARLDQMKLETLAARQQQLADRTAEQAGKDPVKDPQSAEKTRNLEREQADLAKELERQAEQSEPLKKALDAARADQAKQLADKARELAAEERELTQAAKDTQQKQTEAKLADLARQQQQLAEKASQLAKETKQPAQAAKANPLKAEDAQKAAVALKQGEVPEALKRQDQAAKELERVAGDLDKAIEVARDPREAARQLAQLQEGLRQRLAEEAKKKDSQTPLADRLKALEREQKALQQAAEQISVPPKDPAAVKDRRDATEKAAQAAEALNQQAARHADTRMTQTKQALERLADKLPKLDERQRQAAAEVARLRKTQDEIARQAEQALQPSAKEDSSAPKTRDQLAQRLAEAAKRQAESAERLGRTDTPKQEARRERVQEALNRALADLLDARPQDVAASQQEAKRELERLEQALTGKMPADEQARELARRQREAANDAARQAAAKPDAAKQRELQQRQQQIARDTQALVAPEAPQRQAEAAEATRNAEQAANAKPTDAETQKHMDKAAQALERLARQMTGQEGDVARAERLARRQAEAAAQAERLAKKQQDVAQPPEAQRRQQQIAEEAKQVRGGEEGQGEKQRALQALERTQQPAKANEQAKAQRQAADALRDLADKLAGRKDAAAKAAELAREQRELANEAQAAKPKEATEEARQAADRQGELAKQLERLDPKAGAEARKQAAEQMAAARRALENAKSPAEASQPLARAAEATEKLAKQLAKEQADQPATQTSAKPAESSPRQMAQQLARQQRELARETQQTKQQAQGQKDPKAGDAAKKTLEAIGQKQRQLNQQATQLPANQAPKALEQARQAMNQAQQALAKSDAAGAEQKQNQAADALEHLARQVPERSDPATARAKPEGQEAAPPGLPSKQQADQARQLAKEQRDLRAAVQRATSAPSQAGTPKESPVAELARQQQEVARQAADLAKNVGQEQGQKAQPTQQAQQAARSAQQTSNQMQAGALQKAQQAGEQTAQQLRQVAKQLAETPAGKGEPKARDPVQEARDLAQKQEELNRRLEPLVRDPGTEQAQQQARQQDLKDQAGNLMKDLTRLAQQMGRAPRAQQAAQQAASSTQQAQQAMHNAQEQSRQGQQSPAQQSQQQAAQSLDQAAKQAEQAGQQMAGQQAQQASKSPSSQANPQAGKSLDQAQGQMNQAQSKLNQGQTQSAQAAMKQAAEALQKAAEQMAQAQQKPGQPTFPKEPSQLGASGQGKIDLSLLGKDAKKYAGKSWGELPGELQTKIIQDMKAKYGDDYARVIKLYFEQIADTKK